MLLLLPLLFIAWCFGCGCRGNRMGGIGCFARGLCTKRCYVRQDNVETASMDMRTCGTNWMIGSSQKASTNTVCATVCVFITDGDKPAGASLLQLESDMEWLSTSA
eukprot:4169995-Amphidinium_carterae.1